MNFNLEQFGVAQLWKSPHAHLFPLFGGVVFFMVVWLIVHVALVLPAKERVGDLEREWAAVRERLIQHKQAKRIHEEIMQVMRQFPVKEDFIPLALGITDEAKNNQVQLPSFSYQVESSKGGIASKGVFKGAVKGRYQDLRRFIHQLETAEELLFIEDLDVVPAGGRENDMVTFRMRIATYLR